MHLWLPSELQASQLVLTLDQPGSQLMSREFMHMHFKLQTCFFIIVCSDERHARLAKKARPHEHEDEEEEEDLNESNYDEVH